MDAHLIQRTLTVALCLLLATTTWADIPLTNSPPLTNSVQACRHCRSTGKCAACDGNGTARCGRCAGNGKTKTSCSRCGGDGRVTKTPRTGGRLRRTSTSCSHCGGNGKVQQNCAQCGADGKV